MSSFIIDKDGWTQIFNNILMSKRTYIFSKTITIIIFLIKLYFIETRRKRAGT